MVKPLRHSALLFILAFLTGCTSGPDTPGYEYQPDMRYSRSYKSYDTNPLLRDSAQMQTAPEGTVPGGFIPYQLSKTKRDRMKAGEELTNPLEYNQLNLKEGKRYYEIACQPCHGTRGDGQGYLFTEGYYTYKPGDYLSEKMRAAPDGELFHVITVGYNLMGAHGSMFNADERWKLVRYLRYLQAHNQE